VKRVDSKPAFLVNTQANNLLQMAYLVCGGLGTGLEHLGVFKVQEQVQVTGVDAESVDG